MATVSALKAEVRKRLGNPSEEALPSANIEIAIDMALEEVSRVMPVHAYKEIELQTGVQEYDIDKDVVDVIEFWMSYGQSSSELSLPEYSGMRVFHSPSLMHILEHKWEQWNYRYGHDWEFNPDSHKLMVIPAPQYSGKAVYKGSMNRTLTTIPAKYMRPFKDLILAEVLNIATMTRTVGGGDIVSAPIGIGTVTFSSETTAALTKQSEKLRADAIRKFGVGGGAVVIG